MKKRFNWWVFLIGGLFSYGIASVIYLIYYGMKDSDRCAACGKEVEEHHRASLIPPPPPPTLQKRHRVVADLTDSLARAQENQASLAAQYQANASDHVLANLQQAETKISDLRHRLNRAEAAATEAQAAHDAEQERLEVEALRKQSELAELRARLPDLEISLADAAAEHATLASAYAAGEISLSALENAASAEKDASQDLQQARLKLDWGSKIHEAAEKTTKPESEPQEVAKSDDGKRARRTTIIVAAALVLGVGFAIYTTYWDVNWDRLNVDITGESTADKFTFSSGTLPRTVVVKWDFGDGFTARGRDVSHNYLQEGQYLVSMTADAPNGSSRQFNTTIDVQYRPGITVGNIVPGGLTQISSHLGGSNSNLSAIGWSLDGSPLYDETGNSELRLQTPIAGRYEVGLTVWLEDGSAVDAKPAIVNVPGNVNLVASDYEVLRGDTVTFRAFTEHVGNPQYQWTGIPRASGATNTVEMKVGGSICVHVTGDRGFSQGDCVEVKVKAPKMNHVAVSDWENDYWDDLMIHVLAFQEGTNNVEGSATWGMKHKSSASWGFYEKIACSEPRTDIHIWISDLDGRKLDDHGITTDCDGDVALKIRISPGGRILAG